MSAARKATDAVVKKLQKAVKDWASVETLRPFEVEKFLNFLSLLATSGPGSEEIKRTARFNRQKAAQNLARILHADEGGGPMLVFWLSVSSTMTELGRINVDELLRQMRKQSPSYSARLEGEVKMLLQPPHGPSPLEATDRVVARSQSIDGASTFPGEDTNADNSNGTSDTSMQSDMGRASRVEAADLSHDGASNLTRRYELPVQYLAEFLLRVNGGPALEMTVEHGSLSTCHTSQ